MVVREGIVEEVTSEQRHESVEGGDWFKRRAVHVEGAVVGRPEAAGAGAGRWWRRASRAAESRAGRVCRVWGFI